MRAYYNEHDPFKAGWLRQLISDGAIAPGEVDERDIEDVIPDDLRPFRQCHFFAGCGIWSLAARCAGIDDDAPLWSGSCPCQPFSKAGPGGGFTDERHLWPAMHYLVEQCGPSIIVGEQVKGPDGDAWLDVVSADMDATGYLFGATETCAAGFGAPHHRPRNYWAARRMADADRSRLERLPGYGDRGGQSRWHGTSAGRSVASGGLSDELARRGSIPPSPTNGHWRDADWLRCRDTRWRPVQPGTFALAHARTFRNRVGLIRGAGDGITIGQAEGFLRAVIASI